MEENQNESIKDLLKKLAEQNEQLIEKKKPKEWKFPFIGRVNNNKANQGYATFCIIKDNGEVQFIKTQVSEGTAMIEGFPRVAMADYALHYKGKPFYIIPSWSMKPFSPKENLEQTEKDKMHMVGRRLVLERLQREAINPKKKMGGMIGWIILIGVVGIGAYYLISGGKIF